MTCVKIRCIHPITAFVLDIFYKVNCFLLIFSLCFHYMVVLFLYSYFVDFLHLHDFALEKMLLDICNGMFTHIKHSFTTSV